MLAFWLIFTEGHNYYAANYNILRDMRVGLDNPVEHHHKKTNIFKTSILFQSSQSRDGSFQKKPKACQVNIQAVGRSMLGIGLVRENTCGHYVSSAGAVSPVCARLRTRSECMTARAVHYARDTPARSGARAPRRERATHLYKIYTDRAPRPADGAGPPIKITPRTHTRTHAHARAHARAMTSSG